MKRNEYVETIYVWEAFQLLERHERGMVTVADQRKLIEAYQTSPSAMAVAAVIFARQFDDGGSRFPDY